jgi:3-deoxy-manno-octulosonate cytidylyltransferase (CMP-KDO synthetase)
MKIAAIIPARYESTRFRGKPLATICRKPMIQWVYESVQRCSLVEQLFIATDHAEIMQACRGFGANVCMTDPAHATGTDRVAEVAANLDAQIIVNIQGDEPLLTPEVVSEAITPLLEDETIPLGTLKTQIDDERDLHNANVVKVVTDARDFALYFPAHPFPL